MKTNESDIDTPAPMATTWTSEREELYGWFRQNAPSLAAPYEGALRLLRAHGFPGRIHLIAHTVRDICNRLPDFLGSIERNRFQYQQELESLATVWPAIISPSADDYAQEEMSSPESSAIEIPRVAAAAVSQLIDKHRSRQSNKEIVRGLFVLLAEATEHDRHNLEPIVNEFHDTAKWFVERTHLPMKRRTEPSDDELTRRFEQFERIALSLTRDFFKTMDELDDLLQQANTRTD